MNFTGCLMDPLGDEAEMELRDSNTRKMNKINANPLEKTVGFIAGLLTVHLKRGHPTIFAKAETEEEMYSTTQ